MNTIGSANQARFFLATAPATPWQQKLALVIGAAALVVFAVTVPFVQLPLAKMPAFIPAYEFALFFIDLVTAVLLFEQFVRLRLPAVLALAAGYLFDAFMIVPHALTFPGAFAPTGLLGAKSQTTAWLYVFWHGGFPLFVLAYAGLRRREGGAGTTKPGRAVIAAIAGIAVLVAALVLLTTWGHDWLPVIVQNGEYSLLVSKGISPAVWLLTLVAMLTLWQRKQRIVDLWLMLVMWIWLFDIALSAVISSARFDLGWYAGRIFGLIAASFLLITLLIEMAQLYTGALGAAAEAERRFAELARLRARPAEAPRGREKPEDFILRQNVAHYRALLESGNLDVAQRRSIETLLAEEEAKLAAAQRES